jgi:polysaccharide chain length determinant protein (PEP-CTERM system associated)
MHDLAYQVVSTLKAMWRYRWPAVALAWVIALYGWASTYRMPDRYEASARVWVDTQSVLKNLLAGLTAQPNVNQIVVMVSRTLISRPNLERVIRMAGMDVEVKTPRDLEQLTTRLTREVTIQGAGGGDLYTIAYANKDPQQAKRVVQSLLTIFEEGSVSDQRQDSVTARRFIDEQINTAKEKLDALENAVIQFKRQQALVAGGRVDNARLFEAQTALNEATLELKIAETTRDAIKKNYPDELEIPSLLGDKNSDVGVQPETDARIRALEQKLDGLRLNYTEQHPDIAAIVRTIAQLKEQAKAEAEHRRPSAKAEAEHRRPSLSAAQALDTGNRAMTLTQAAAEANVASAKARVDEYRKRYEELKAAAIATPQVDADYAHLNRDYELAKGTYVALLQRRETARMSNEMETGARVTNFRVIDPPRVSSIPSAPNRQLLNSMVLLAALAGGAGLAFVLSQIRPAFNDERKLREVSGVEVLGTVVMAWTDAQKARRTRGLVALMISFLSLLSAYAAIMVLAVLTASRA